ncbi:MAG: DinB family protein [Bacteroidota bacterium]
MTSKELLKRWKGNKNYTLRIIDRMPEEHFAYRPFVGSKTFKSQISHISSWLRSHSKFVTGEVLPKPQGKNKVDMMRDLEACFDYLIQFISESSLEALLEKTEVWYGQVSRGFVLQTMDNHLSHHRGQMVLYLRMKEITPPSYVGW